MTNIVQIIKLANAGSLCLIDELGAGTDPVEGAALAIAILERLRDKHAKIASTTHYAELKEFALRTPGVENGSCEFDVATLNRLTDFSSVFPARVMRLQFQKDSE